MTQAKQLLQQLAQVEKIATASKFRRMLAHPLRYFHAIGFRELSYKKKQQSKQVLSNTFFNIPMQLLLPASTDIYLTGGKSHDSEIRLARFIIQHLKAGADFLDIGAHYGYFSLLASKVSGAKGKVLSIEAAQNTFTILKQNTRSNPQIQILHKAVSDSRGTISFYEFPNLYSEYNSMDASQFEEEEWFKKAAPKKTQVASLSLDDLLVEQAFHPQIIKIDVEGAEEKVIRGGKQFLQENAPVVIVEYLSEARGNVAHQEAAKMLGEWGYGTHIIDTKGQLVACVDLEGHLEKGDFESDNVVFVR